MPSLEKYGTTNYISFNNIKDSYIRKDKASLYSLFFIFILADGDGGMNAGSCPNRAESSPLDDKSKSLVLVNYFESIPLKQTACENNSGDLINMLKTCYNAAGNRWANFVAVDYYKVYKVWSLTQHTYFLIFIFFSCLFFSFSFLLSFMEDLLYH